MSLRTLMGSHCPMAAESGAIRGSEGSTFLSGLDQVFVLANLECPSSIDRSAAAAAVILGDGYFELGRVIDRPCSFEAVCGGDWSQSWWSVLELARQTIDWTLDHQLDPQEEHLVSLWNEAIGLALWSEVTARTHLLPCPYWAWQAGLALACTAISEQLRLLAQPGRSEAARLGPQAMRQVENLVMQQGWPSCLSLVQAVRKGSYLGPWPAVALAHRLARSRDSLGWVAGVLGEVEQLPSTLVLEKCLRMRLRSLWPEYLELAERAWRAVLAMARRQRG